MISLSHNFTPSPIVAQLLVALSEYEDLFERSVDKAASSSARTRSLALAGVELYGERILAICAVLPDDGLDGRKFDQAIAVRPSDETAGIEQLLISLSDHEDFAEGCAQRACTTEDDRIYGLAVEGAKTSARRIAEIRAVLPSGALPRRRLDA